MQSVTYVRHLAAGSGVTVHGLVFRQLVGRDARRSLLLMLHMASVRPMSDKC